MDDIDFDKLTWCEIDGTLLFLDIERDRYFRLSREENEKVLGSLDASGRGRTAQPEAWPRPSSFAAPLRQCASVRMGPFRLDEVARAIWLQRRVERRLAKGSLETILSDVRRVASRANAAAHTADPNFARIVRAFENARLLRTAADRCLPRSVALSLALAARGCPTHVVLGVKLAPFAAHCWTQAGDEVLSDTAEEVQRYTPILVI